MKINFNHIFWTNNNEKKSDKFSTGIKEIFGFNGEIKIIWNWFWFFLVLLLVISWEDDCNKKLQKQFTNMKSYWSFHPEISTIMMCINIFVSCLCTCCVYKEQFDLELEIKRKIFSNNRIIIILVSLKVPIWNNK